jgi:hypothetical protein
MSIETNSNNLDLIRADFKGLIQASPGIEVVGYDKEPGTIYRLDRHLSTVDMNTSVTKPVIQTKFGEKPLMRQLPIILDPRKFKRSSQFDIYNRSRLIGERYITEETRLGDITAVIRANWSRRETSPGSFHNVVVSFSVNTSNPDAVMDWELIGRQVLSANSPILTPLKVYELLPEFQQAGKGKFYSDAQIAVIAKVKGISIEAAKAEVNDFSAKGRANFTDRLICVAMPVDEVDTAVVEVITNNAESV